MKTNNIPQDRINNLSVWTTFFLAFVLLSAAHLVVKEIFPNPVYWFIGVSFIVAISLGWIILRRNDFGFILAILICVHFSFADTQGGLWSYIICAVLFVRVIVTYDPSLKLSAVPLSANILVIIIIFHQFLGTILNPYPLIANIQATIVMLSQVLIFYFCASQKMNQKNVKLLMMVWFITAGLVFIIGLNQHYHWVIAESPLLPQRYNESGLITTIPAGSFGSSELFSEYFCIVFAFSLILFGYNNQLGSLYIQRTFPLLILLISSAALVMGASRAAVILALSVVIYMFFINICSTVSANSLKRVYLFGFAVLLLCILIWSLGSYFAYDEMVEDFRKLNFSTISIDTVSSGESINRAGTYSPAYKRLKNGSWWIGNGYNIPENNQKSLGIPKGGMKDFHSLYLCLPFYYGWVGAIAFVILIFLTGLRCYIYHIKTKNSIYYLSPIALGFAITWGIFLADQYKITATRQPSYYIFIWLLLGLSHAVSNTIRLDISAKK